MLRRSLALTSTAAGLLWLTACSDPVTGINDDCDEGTPVINGSVIDGTLGPGDELDVDGAYLDAYLLTVPSVTTYVITMRSAEVDAWLWVRAGYGAVYGDDDSGGGVNGSDARIFRSLVGSCYRIEATTLGIGEVGAYTLTVEQF